MGKRRYSLPEQEADIAKLALQYALTDLESIMAEDPYFKLTYAKMKELLTKLENYQWRT